MSFPAGTRIGPYVLQTLVGAGGMGEVYRSHDSTLHRDVAIKILPELFATDPDRLARFSREAQTLAALSHPNVAQIYGLVDAPLEGTGRVHALVMEWVDGEDLAGRIARGPIPVDEALPIAKQVAEALEAAHEHGIVHRDVKPANIRRPTAGACQAVPVRSRQPGRTADVASGRDHLTQVRQELPLTRDLPTPNFQLPISTRPTVTGTDRGTKLVTTGHSEEQPKLITGLKCQ